MINIANFLEGLEKLAYKILLWIILLPKTLLKIILDPRWAPGYIEEELHNDQTPPFDEYMSPIILFLVVTLIPASFLSILPTYGVQMVSPTDQSISGRTLTVDAEARFKPNSTDVHHEFWWIVSKTETNGAGTLSTFLGGESHSDLDGVHQLNSTFVKSASVSASYSFQVIDPNTLRDGYSYTFTDPGNYYVDFRAVNFRTNLNHKIEDYYGTVSVFVPADPEAPMTISAANVGFTSVKPLLAQQTGQSRNVEDILTSEGTYVQALILLSLPLLFALATKIFTGVPIGEEGIRESFYAQCYYFAPLSLFFWASYYSGYFYTPDIFPVSNPSINIQSWIGQATLIAIAIWFIAVETAAIARERKIRLWGSALILVVCLVILITAYYVYTALSLDFYLLRKSAIWFYPLASLAIAVSFVFVRIGKRVVRRRRKS
ncbi:MAG TPA: hypothetical protein VMT73_03770 [Anaerolineales bacterium]|nr:hypothetical protein [Anaerolineales bacterium]